MNTNEKLSQFIMAKAKIDSGKEITEESDLIYDLGLDSLTLVELIVDIEIEFGVEIGEDALDVIYKYGTLLAYINEHI